MHLSHFGDSISALRETWNIAGRHLAVGNWILAVKVIPLPLGSGSGRLMRNDLSLGIDGLCCVVTVGPANDQMVVLETMMGLLGEETFCYVALTQGKGATRWTCYVHVKIYG